MSSAPPSIAPTLAPGLAPSGEPTEPGRVPSPESRLAPASPPSLAERFEAVRVSLLAIPGAARFVRALLLLGQGFSGEAITLRAAALTYLTLFSLVPLLAVVYSVIDVVSGEERVRAAVMGWINAQLGIGAGAAISVKLADFTHKASVKAVGSIGFAALLFSALSLLWNIESAFNHIYAVKQPRAVLDRLLKYWSFLTLGPVLLAGSLALTWRISALQAAHDHPGHSELLHTLTALSSVGITYAALTWLYKVLPNARVRLQSAVAAALFSGTLWEVAKFVFAWASTRMVQLHKIYGSLAVLPITLTWIWISWLIALVGCRFCFALEESRRPPPHPQLDGGATREALCARVMVELVRQHHLRREPVRASWIARELELDRALVVQLLRLLSQAGTLAAETRAGRWLPGREPGQITLAELRSAARSTLRLPRVELDPLGQALEQAWRGADGAAAAALGESVQSLLAREPGRIRAPASAPGSAPATTRAEPRPVPRSLRDEADGLPVPDSGRWER